MSYAYLSFLFLFMVYFVAHRFHRFSHLFVSECVTNELVVAAGYTFCNQILAV